MTPHRTIVSVLTSLLLVATILAVIMSGSGSPEAAQRRAAYAVTGAGFCATPEGAGCMLAAAATIDAAAQARGAFLLSLESPRRHLIVSVRTGAVESVGGGLRATFEGSAIGEDLLGHELTHVVQQRYRRAVLAIDEEGTAVVILDDTTVMSMMVSGGVGIRPLEPSRGSPHEVGHWLGSVYGAHTSAAPAVGFGFIVQGIDTSERPEVAGLFKDTADGETGHAHGHLDHLKRVGDPATNAPLGFEGSGSATCVFEDGRETATGFNLEADLAAALLTFDAPACRFRDAMPIRQLPCPQPCRATTIIGPAVGVR